jgi:hypothetical protein
MTAIVAGIYQDGKLELLEKPAGLKKAPYRFWLQVYR